MTTSADNKNNLFGHPRGLYLLFATEMWERFSYYAMRALLVLYLVDQTTGLGWDHANALQLYGSFTMLVYVTPLFGGWLADNILGQRRAVITGSILMAAGQFCLALPHSWLSGYPLPAFYTGLALLVLGNGLFKPNISTMVGDLYSAADRRRDSAYTIFYLGINSGMFLAGICVGLVIDLFGTEQIIAGNVVYSRNYQAGFLLAGCGMLLALLLQLTLAKSWLGEIGNEPAAKQSKRQLANCKPALTKEEKDRFKVILIMGLFTIIFWAGFEQAGGLMNIYADRFVDRTFAGITVNPVYFQSLNPFFILLFAPFLAALWLKLGKHEPNSPVKFALGLALLGIGYLLMVGAAFQLETTGVSSAWWLIGAYLFFTLGELCLSPIGLALVTRLSPVRMASLMMGSWYLFMAAANKLAGLIGAMIGSGGSNSEQQMAANAFAIFSALAVVAIASGLLLYLSADKLVKWMHGAEPIHSNARNTATPTASHPVPPAATQ